MTEEEKIAFVKALVNDDKVTEGVIAAYLSLSSQRIVEKCYPFNGDGKTMPDKYDLTQCELASRMIIRRGAEGQLSSSEGEISRQYGSVDDEDILARVTPFVGVAGV